MSAIPPWLRLALYARVSSEGQKVQETIASQVAVLEERIRQDGGDPATVPRFLDDGYSGSTLVRPGLEQLRDLAASGGLDRLYVLAPDRLARHYAYQVLLRDELRRAGVEVIFLNQPAGGGPEGELLRQVQGVIAEYERAQILERSRRGKRHATRAGKVSVLSSAPYGYRYVGKRDGAGEARYEVVAEQARIVQQIFSWVGQERLSLEEVARRLTRAEVPTPRGRSRWGRTSVWNLLTNPAYRGTAAFGRRRLGEPRPRLRPGRGRPEQPRRPASLYRTPEEDWLLVPVPALVSAALFAAVQEQLAENRRRQRAAAARARYLLQGLLVCRSCGYALCSRTVPGPGRRQYYRCGGTDARRHGGQRACAVRPLRCDALDGAVWDDVCALLLDPEKLAAEYQRRLAEAPAGEPAAGLQARLEKCRRRLSRLIDSYSEGLLDKAEFEPRLRQARAELARAEAEAQAQADRAAAARELKLVIGRLQDFAAQVRDGLAGASWEQRRELIRTLVKRIEVDAEAVRVIYRVNLPPFAKGPSWGQWQDCPDRQRAALPTSDRSGPSGDGLTCAEQCRSLPPHAS
jgi:site-specific DNA recombinase